jgi:hypothetical protein
MFYRFILKLAIGGLVAVTLLYVFVTNIVSAT